MKNFTLLLLLASSPFLFGQTIAEKKESFKKCDQELDYETLDQLRQVNNLIEEKHFELKQLYDQAFKLYQEEAAEKNYEPLIKAIKTIKDEIAEIQKMWRDETSSYLQNDEYALWHQPETTLQQLVLDYGACDYIYLVPPEIGGFRISINSNLPIPRESWSECLELILSQYGIGIRQLNPYLRELFIQRNDPSGIKAIVDDPSELDFFPPHSRLCFVLQPCSTDPRSDLRFLQKFSNTATTSVEIIGGKIFITGPVDTIQELMKLYGFVKTGGGRQEFQLVTLSKINAREMETILNTAFYDGKPCEEGASLRAIPLQNLPLSLFLSGSKEEVKKAVKLIEELESQIEDPQEKTVFWYTAKHSDAEELATVLAKVYDLLIEGGEPSFSRIAEAKLSQNGEKKKDEKLVIPQVKIEPKSDKKISHKTADGQNNFIVDPKTGSIIMVVEQEALPKIKELLKKLDVPKKMVQLEILLFEKNVSNQSKVGLNLLRLGDSASQKSGMGLSWNAPSLGLGILEFLISRSKGSGIPAYDLAYQFMLGQENIQINASPSIMTMNQTPATIAIVDELSIDAGADDKKSRIYTRAQYGITIQITPTINFDEASDEGGFVTLETDITFDTPKKSADDRPEVARRHIKNHVRIADGQTVILGGLRRKNSQDNKDSIPFLGEIPGLGKLFSHTEMNDTSTEMFVFITPKIITDPILDAERIKREELKKRPGDMPEFLHELTCARDAQKRRLFEGSLTALFGRHAFGEHSHKPSEEYDGR